MIIRSSTRRGVQSLTNLNPLSMPMLSGPYSIEQLILIIFKSCWKFIYTSLTHYSASPSQSSVSIYNIAAYQVIF